MKSRLLSIAVFIVLASAAALAHAATGTVKGQVQYIRTHDAGQYPGFAAPKFWFTLKGVTVAGACPAWQGLVLFAAQDKQELSLVLAAQVSGLEVEAAFNDAVLQDSTWCIPGFVTTGNPAPVN